RKPTTAALVAVVSLIALVGFPSMTALWVLADRERQAKEQERDRAAAAQDDLERAVYASRIVLAQRAYGDNDVSVTRSLLEQAGPQPDRPDLRGWEWHYLDRLCQADLHPGMGHTLGGWIFIHALAVFPNGQCAVTGAGLPGGQRDAQGRPSFQSPGEVRM